jgi:hypothetical protein
MQTALLVSLQSIDVTLSLLIEMSFFFVLLLKCLYQARQVTGLVYMRWGVSILPFYDFGIGIGILLFFFILLLLILNFNSPLPHFFCLIIIFTKIIPRHCYPIRSRCFHSIASS